MIETSLVCAHCLFMQMTLTKKKNAAIAFEFKCISPMFGSLALCVCVCCFYCFFLVLSFCCFPKHNHTLPWLKSTKQMGPCRCQICERPRSRGSGRGQKWRNFNLYNTYSYKNEEKIKQKKATTVATWRNTVELFSLNSIEALCRI